MATSFARWESHLITAIPNSRFLDCQAHGEVPIKVTWLKNGVKVSENKRIQVLSNGSLYISEVEGKRGEQYDEGFYQCLAMNNMESFLVKKLTLPYQCAPGLPRWLSGKESACQCKRHRRRV